MLGLNNPSLLARWVNDFRDAGADALKPCKKERVSSVKKAKKKNAIQEEALLKQRRESSTVSEDHLD